SVHTYRRKHSRISTAGTDRVHQRSVAEDDRLARDEVRRRHRQWLLELFKRLALQEFLEKWHHAVVGTKAKPRNRPACKVLEPHQGGKLDHLANAYAAAIHRGDHCAHARTRNEIDRNILFFQYLQHPNVSQAAGKSAAESHTDLRPLKWFWFI